MTATRRRVAATVLSAALLAGSLAAYSTGPAEPEVATLTIAFDSDSAALGYDPLEYGANQRQFYEGLYDSLFVLEADGTVSPGLARDVEYNADSTVMVLTLLAGVDFVDGSSLDAQLVKKNLDRRSNPALVAYSVFAEGGAAEIASVDVIDDTHLSITFTKPQPGAEVNFTGIAGMIVGKSAIDDPATLKTAPDGSGPYTLDPSTAKGSSYVFVKKADHRDADDYAYDRIVTKPILEPSARINAVITGQADVGYVLTSLAWLAESKGIGVSQVGGTVASLLVFDKSGATSGPFADPRVRLALGMAIDREDFVEGVHPGERPTVNALPSGNPGYDASLEAEFGYDPKRAKQLLAEAGYPDGFSFTVVSTEGSATDLQAFQRYFAEIGVTMNVQAASSTEQAYGAVRTTPLGYVPINWSNPAGAMYGIILGFANPHGEANPALLDAMQALGGAADDTARAQALSALNRELVSSGWLIPVFEQLTTWVHQDTVQPVTFPAGGDMPLLSSFAPAS